MGRISKNAFRFVFAVVASLLVLTSVASTSFAEEATSFFEEAKLLAPDGNSRDSLGNAVALEGDTLVVANYVDDDRLGSAYVFERSPGGAGEWGLSAKLVVPEGDRFFTYFGSAVAISGDTIVIGASSGDGREIGSGSAYVFERDVGGVGAWGVAAKIVADDGQHRDDFGGSVAIADDTILVGAPDSVGSLGSAYLYERDLGGRESWGQRSKLLAPDGSLGDHFGFAVALYGDTAVIGAKDDDAPETDSGAAYVFERDISGSDGWGISQKLSSLDAGANDRFGYSLAMEADRLVVGARRFPFETGAVYVFERDPGSIGPWQQVAELVIPNGTSNDHLGESVALHGDIVVTAAPVEDAGGTASGAVYVYRMAPTSGGWEQIARMTQVDPVDGALLGQSVAIDGGNIVAGAPGADGSGGRPNERGQGAAYVFQEILIDPALALAGTCPGEIELAATGATPRGGAELWVAASEGSTLLDEGPCVGRELPLEDAKLLRSENVDETGSRSIVRQAARERCDAYLLLLDLTTCVAADALSLAGSE